MATIYKIWSEKGEKVYIGSTILSLRERWYKHSCPSANNTNSRLLFEEYGKENCKIEKIEDVKEDEQIERERYWIEFFEDKVVNRQIPGRTDKEYHTTFRQVNNAKRKASYYENRDEELIKLRQNYLLHREDRITYAKENGSKRVECECGAIIRKDSLSKHKRTTIHLSKVNNISTCK